MKKTENQKTAMLKILPIALAGMFLAPNASYASKATCSVFAGQNLTGGNRNQGISCAADAGSSCSSNSILRTVVGGGLNDAVKSAQVKVENISNDDRAQGTLWTYKHGDGSGGTINTINHMVDEVDDNDDRNRTWTNFDGSDVSSFKCRIQSWDDY